MISLIIKALGSTDTRLKACLRLEEEGGGDSAATRRKACLRLEEEVAKAVTPRTLGGRLA